MGYFKIVEYGDTTETYLYEKDITPRFKNKKPSKMAIKRLKDIRNLPNYSPSIRSVKRAKTNFFRLVHHNNIHASSITFITLTFNCDYPYGFYGRYLALFISKLNKQYASKTHKQITYIGVPELTKKGRYHYHLLVYDLSPTIVKNERYTRNLQRLFQRGYIDARLAKDTSPKIAGYMAKYMAKHFSTPGNTHKRAYNCSRKIKKISSHGRNTPIEYTYLVSGDLPPQHDLQQYQVPYMGMCIKTIYKKKTTDTIKTLLII